MTPRAIHPASRRSAALGLTFVELLIAATIFVVVLGLGSVFFARQVDLQRAVQARNDVQDRMRTVSQLVTQDLSLSGSTVRMNDQGLIAANLTSFGPACSVQNCLALDLEASALGEPTESSMSMRYMSSQFPAAESCREIQYRVSAADVLQRSDVQCTAAPFSTDAFVDLAPDVMGFVVVFVCSNGTRITSFPGNAACPVGSSYARSALVSIAAESTIPVSRQGPPVELVSTTPASPTVLDCLPGRFCFSMTQEILLPNLKD